MSAAKYFKRGLFASLVFGLFPLYLAFTLRIADFNDLIFFSLGGGTLSSLTSLHSRLLFAVAPLVFLYLYSDFLTSDLETAAVYVFTRRAGYARHVRRKLAWLLFHTAVYTFLCMLWTLSVIAAFGMDGQKPDLALLLLPGMLSLLFNMALVLAIGLIALLWQALYAYLIVATLYVITALAVPLLPGKSMQLMLYVNPFAQGFYAWHMESAARYPEYPGGSSTLTAVYSCCYLVVFIVIEAWLFYRWLKTADYR